MRPATVAGHPEFDLRPSAHWDAGPLHGLLTDPGVTEIMINGAGSVFVERAGRKSAVDVRFESDAALQAWAERLFATHGKRIGTDTPYADVCLEDGTRVNAIIAPLARHGMAVTLRKFTQEIASLDDLVRRGALTSAAAQFLTACIKCKINIVFSGGTSSGKTTLLQVLSSEFAPDERVITIEDAAELRLLQPNVVSLETRAADISGQGEVTLRHLIRNALRMAPDRLVIGEVRGAEAVDMIQAMATGHTGTLGVVHGSSPEEVLRRLETMVLMADLGLPLSEVRKMIGATIQLVVHLARTPTGRRVTAITELRGVTSEDRYVLNDLFAEPPGQGRLEPVMGYFPKFYDDLKRSGLVVESLLEHPDFGHNAT